MCYRVILFLTLLFVRIRCLDDVCTRDCMNPYHSHCLKLYSNYTHATDFQLLGMLLDSDGNAVLYTKRALSPFDLPIAYEDVCKGTYLVNNCELLQVKMSLHCMTQVTYTDMYTSEIVNKLAMPKRTWQHLEMMALMRGDFLEIIDIKYFLLTKSSHGNIRVLQQMDYPRLIIILPIHAK